jgi:hypothetical protein
MPWKAKVQIIWNFFALLPALFYFLAWLSLSLQAFFISIQLFIFMGSTFLIISSIVSAIGLKLLILRDVGDSNLRPVRDVYYGAFKVNIVSYFILYPLMFGLSASQFSIGVIFLVVALIMAIPIRVYMSSLSKEYREIKRRYVLGKWTCRRCKVSLSYVRRYRRWKCHRCGKWY